MQLVTPKERAEWGRKSRHQHWMEAIKNATDGDHVRYYARRNSMRERILRNIWLDSRKCPSHVVEGSLYPLDDATLNAELLHWWTEGAQEIWRSRFHRYAVKHDLDWETVAEDLVEPHKFLQAIAARLGFEWSLMVGSFDSVTPWGYISGSIVDREFLDSRREHHGWRYQLTEALALSPRGRVDAVVHAVRGVVGMREAGYEADIEYIVETLCETDGEWRKEGAKDCATALREAETRLDPQDIDALRALDEIDAAPRELDSYQYF